MVDIPGDTSTTATLTVGVSRYDTLEVAGDHDWYRIELVAGQTYEFRLHGEGTSELVDPYVYLRDSSGVLVGSNDDAGGTTWDGANGLDSRLIFTATASGTYYVDVGEFGDNAAGDYLITAVQHNPTGMVFTNDEIAWQLTNNFAEFFGDPPAAFNVGIDGQITVNVTALTAAGQTLALAALQAWEDLTGIDFVTTSGAAEITFDDSDPGTNAYANTAITGNTITSATVMITEGWLTTFGTGFNSYSFETYIHEIGHALGLGHGGNYNGSATYGVDNFYLNDSLAYSIMSYMQVNGDEFSGPNTSVPADFRFMLTPAVADYIAITNLYGDNSNTRTGNTTYGYNSNTGNTVLDQAVTIGSDVFFMVHDDGGTDTLDFSGYSGAQFISLFAEQTSNVLGGIWNLWISRGTTIENAIGGSGNDVIRGNNVSNTLDGRGGVNDLYGNGGNDIYIVSTVDRIYENAGQGTDWVYARGSYALASGVSIERLATTSQGGTASINLTGNELGQHIHGNNGNNSINGGAGNDIIYGYGGNDYILGAQGIDHLYGGAGNDRFVFRESQGSSSGIDRIYDLTPADRIRIDAISVTATTSLTSAQFRIGTAALDADDRVVYDPTTGVFRYDPDGNGSQGAIIFGVVDGAPTLDHSYFELA